MLCDSCGSQLPSHARFCLDCGARVDVNATGDPDPAEALRQLSRLAERDPVQAASIAKGLQAEVTGLFKDFASRDPILGASIRARQGPIDEEFIKAVIRDIDGAPRELRPTMTVYREVWEALDWWKRRWKRIERGRLQKNKDLIKQDWRGYLGQGRTYVLACPELSSTARTQLEGSLAALATWVEDEFVFELLLTGEGDAFKFDAEQQKRTSYLLGTRLQTIRLRVSEVRDNIKRFQRG